MNKAKPFDAVAMKNAIQARHRRARAGLSDRRVRQAISRRLAASKDTLASLWRKLPDASSHRKVTA